MPNPAPQNCTDVELNVQEEPRKLCRNSVEKYSMTVVGFHTEMYRILSSSKLPRFLCRHSIVWSVHLIAVRTTEKCCMNSAFNAGGYLDFCSRNCLENGAHSLAITSHFLLPQ